MSIHPLLSKSQFFTRRRRHRLLVRSGVVRRRSPGRRGLPAGPHARRPPHTTARTVPSPARARTVTLAVAPARRVVGVAEWDGELTSRRPQRLAADGRRLGQSGCGGTMVGCTCAAAAARGRTDDGTRHAPHCGKRSFSVGPAAALSVAADASTSRALLSEDPTQGAASPSPRIVMDGKRGDLV